MLSLHDRPLPPTEGPNRREWLRVGGLSLAGLSLPALLRAEQAAAAAPSGAPTLASRLGAGAFGQAKNVIYLWLQGGPPQHETFDPKPEAPAEIRGPFKPIQTSVSGTHFCELLPRTARIAHKLAVVRSMHTDDDSHDVSGYWVLTGYPYPGASGSARQIKPVDWPYFGSVLKMVKPSKTLPALTSVWIPDVMRLNDSVTPAGQTAGFLGKQWEPERFVGDPAAENYTIEGITLPQEVSVARFDRRHDLLGQLDRRRRQTEANLASWGRMSQHAFDLITSGKAREAFDLRKEPPTTRDRYGRNSWGQSVLLARRLIEAGVRLVHVNWPREGGDSAVDNPMWDTHAGNADRLQDCLCPQFDVAFPALIEDLEQRGLLQETLVVAIGEFGRTPRINSVGGRDHWGRVFSFALAGAGVAGGALLGASDKTGALPAEDPVRPHDLTASIFHLLGVDHHGMFLDRTNRPNALTKGEPIQRILGRRPAPKRAEPGGDLAFVPPYDDRKLLDLDFAWGKLTPCSPPSREKGWRGTVGVSVGKGGARIEAPEAGKQAILAQGIRSGRGGDYTFTVNAALEGDPKAISCRLLLFRFADVSLNPEMVQELASLDFHPTREAQEFRLQRFLGSTSAGANFRIGNGLGVAVIVKRAAPGQASLTIRSVSLEFSSRPRNENVVD